MGTSSLYGGPKKTSLLPSDYDPDGIGEPETPVEDSPENPESDADNPAENEPQQDNPYNGEPEGQENDQPVRPSFSWGTARGSMRKAMGNRSSGNVKSAIRNYTKALGGHTNATRQASKARKAASVLYAYFAGTPDTIRKRLEDSGIRFDGRPIREIFKVLPTNA